MTTVPDYAVRLSPHFTLAEMCATSRWEHAERNVEIGAGHPYRENLTRLCETILEPLRAHFGAPVLVSSGMRYAEQVDGRWRGLDVAIRTRGNVGYLPKSQHTRGEAADIHVRGIDDRDVWEWIYHKCPNAFGQVIRETSGGSTWTHVSIPGWRVPERGGSLILGEVLDYTNGKYTRIDSVRRWGTM